MAIRAGLGRPSHASGKTLGERAVALDCGAACDIARLIGATIDFQDKSPTGKPGHGVRYRLGLEGREPIRMDGIDEFVMWIKSNRRELIALAERAKISGTADATASPVPPRARRSL